MGAMLSKDKYSHIPRLGGTKYDRKAAETFKSVPYESTTAGEPPILYNPYRRGIFHRRLSSASWEAFPGAYCKVCKDGRDPCWHKSDWDDRHLKRYGSCYPPSGVRPGPMPKPGRSGPLRKQTK